MALGAWAGSTPARHRWRGLAVLGMAGRGAAVLGVAGLGVAGQCKGKFVVMVAGWFDSTRHN